MQKNEYVNLTTGEIKAFYTRWGAWHYFKKDAKKWGYNIKRKDVQKYENVVIFTKTIKYATFVDEYGFITTSEIYYDELNDYEYVKDLDGQTWLLNQVHIIGIREKTQTEACNIDDFVDFD